MPAYEDMRREYYAGYQPGEQPYSVGGDPWAMPGIVAPGQMPSAPGQMGQFQGLGNWGNDPFGYTQGSMLTPWTQPLPTWQGGGYAAPNLTQFSYGDFGYNFRDPGGFAARPLDTPERFTHYNFEAPQPFRAPSQDEILADPNYQARLTSGTNAINRSAAAAGNLRGGGTLRGLMEYGQRLASEEGDKIYGRRASEYDRAYGISKDVYGTNRSNAAENYDRNITNRLRVAEGNEDRRLAGYQADAASAASMGRLGYDVATGTYDRNRQNAMDSWQSAMDAERARASAANAGSAQDYNRQMAEYGLAMDIYNMNQDRQWGRLMDMTSLGYGAAGQQAGYAGIYGGNVGDYYTGAANARAAGTVAGGNAWNSALGGIGQSAMDYYLMSGMGGFGGVGTNVGYPRIPRI
jgi:hypothetical protein